MINDKKKINYKEELNNLRNYGKFIPEMGEYNIKFLSDGVEESRINNDTGEITTYIVFQIEVDDKLFTWSVNKGNSVYSLYGQIIKVASNNNNSLVGACIVLEVKYNGVTPDGRFVKEYKVWW